MLNLSVSSQPCLPGKQTPVDEQRPQTCGTCGAPGGPKGELLEGHIVGANKRRYLCPLCHACLHLDYAGRMNAGRIVWLPELSQEELNILCLASFVAMRREGVNRNDPKAVAMVKQIVRLYQSFEKRAEAVELFLGGGANQSPLPRQALSHPTYVASLIVKAQQDAKLDARTLAKRVEGLRLLPARKAFERYVAQASRIIASQGPVDQWMSMVEAQLEAQASRHVPNDEDEQFDATPVAELA
jgi:hypothetical protein